MERAYTVAEIDQMRSALRKKYPPPYIGGSFGNTAAYESYMRGVAEASRGRDERIEQELRTYMLAGIDPSELEKP